MDSVIRYIYSFFIWNINSSIKASILIIFILLIRALLRKKIGVKFRYIIWFLVAFRLIVPNTLEINSGFYDYIPTLWKMPSIVSINERNNINLISVQNNLKNSENCKDGFNFKLQDKTQGIKKPIINSLSYVLFLIWLIGALLYLVFIIYQNLRFNKIIKNETVIEDFKIVNMFEECKKEIYIKKNISLILTEEVKTPSLYGLKNPKLLLPQGILKTFTFKDLRYIFLHELAHQKRKDILVYWFITILKILHWFNPLVLYGFSRMQEDCEFCCDSVVLSYIGEEESIKYGYTIIKFLEIMSSQYRLIITTPIAKSKSQIKRRIIMIKSFKKNSYKLSILSIVIIITIGFLSLRGAKMNPIDENKVILNKKSVILYSTHILETYNSGETIGNVTKSLNEKLLSAGLKSKYLEMPKNTKPIGAYSISRKLIIDNAKDYNKNVLLDIHRDGSSINMKNIVCIVLGMRSQHFNENYKFANSLSKELNKVNGIKAIVVTRKDGRYNQDLSKEAILINIGNTYSSKEDIDNCVHALSESLNKVIPDNNH